MNDVVDVHTIVLTGSIAPEQEKGYLHVPFDMPPRAVRLDVSYSYSDPVSSDPRLRNGNTLDLGVFDERGIAPITAGFRGHSGSARPSFFITETAATPGYLEGPLNPGRWHIMLGPYKVAPQGCTYRVEVRVAVSEGRRSLQEMPYPVATLPSSRPRARFAPWLRGELHCHTFHSDGASSAAEVVDLALARGLDFLAIADHHTLSAHRELAGLPDPGLILVRAVEATAFRAHLNVWGVSRWIDDRVQTAEEMATVIAAAKAYGGLTSCNHPRPFGPDWDYRSVTTFDCVEVWNGPWVRDNQLALDFWLEQLAAGRHAVAVGGSDYHRPTDFSDDPYRGLGAPTTWVYAPGATSEADVVNAIRRGRVALSDRPDGPHVELCGPGGALTGDLIPRRGDGRLAVRVRCRRAAGCRLTLHDQAGVLSAHDVAGDDFTVEPALPDAFSLYVRAELRNAAGVMRALTNPLFIEERSRSDDVK